MSKEKTEPKSPQITPGETIIVEAPTRAECAEKVAKTKQQAAEQGLVCKSSGFIHYIKEYLSPGKFTSRLEFQPK